jgi:hypothetical protein
MESREATRSRECAFVYGDSSSINLSVSSRQNSRRSSHLRFFPFTPPIQRGEASALVDAALTKEGAAARSTPVA